MERFHGEIIILVSAASRALGVQPSIFLGERSTGVTQAYFTLTLCCVFIIWRMVF